MQCPNCHEGNPKDSRFCQSCGTPLKAQASTTSVATRQERPSPSLTTAPPAAPPPSVAAPPPSGSRSPAASTPQMQHRMASARPAASPADKQLGQGGTAAADIWGPFAGYGERGHYASWLLDDLAERGDELHNAVSERFRGRQVPGARGAWRTMTGRGLIVERRHFYLIQRGITTVALYIGQFGKDLFISQVTYAQGPISNVRGAILGLMLLFQLYYIAGYTSSLNQALGSFNPLFGGRGGGGDLAFLLCVVGPLGLLNSMLLGVALLYSVYKWLSIKDFAALLRVPPNEFQLDDIIALEKSVEETVRQSLDAIGIDTVLMPPAKEYGFRTRLI